MEYVKIPSNRFNDVIEHLRNTFFADEPLNKSVHLCEPGEGHLETEKYCLKTLEDGLSVMAITSEGEIAGVALNGILLNGDVENALENLQTKQNEKFIKIFNFLYTQNLKQNLFKQFNVDKLFEVRILSVNPKFRGQGIARNLLVKSQEVAEENGFKIMKSDATGLFSQKVSTSLGFITCTELRYDEYVDENNKRIFSVEPPHESFKLMCKILDDEHVTSF